ncbi:uncharacterized protein [Nicotiana tomentosiformis]|uniref:uncharacterized protein n=1 Tax=Nicotiana tomentosiformis TaxID=4098 RepID=UPI00388CDAFC
MSTAEELEKVALFKEFLERKFYLGTGLHPELRFGIPKDIACDNGTQFIDAKVTKFLEDLKIKRITSSPYHTSTNSQAESTNKVIIQKPQEKVGSSKRQMARRIARSSMGLPNNGQIEYRRNSLSLVYGVVALISVEVGEPTLRHFWADEESNNEAMLINLELLEEHRCLMRQQQKAYYEDNSNKTFDSKANKQVYTQGTVR